MKRRRRAHDLDHSPYMRCDAAALGDLFDEAIAERERERSLRLRGDDAAAIALERQNDGFEKGTEN
jgi:hypothetical protein